MGGSRLPSRLTVMEVLERNRSNLPNAVRQPISLIAHFQGVFQIPGSQQHRRRNIPRRGGALQFSRNHSPHTRHHQHPARRPTQTISSIAINYSTSTPQRPTPTTTFARRFFLAHTASRKKRRVPTATTEQRPWLVADGVSTTASMPLISEHEITEGHKGSAQNGFRPLRDALIESTLGAVRALATARRT
jgi:hypothetical protein